MGAERSFALIAVALCLACPTAAGAQSARKAGKRMAPRPAATITADFAAQEGTAAQRRIRMIDLGDIDAADPGGQQVVRSLPVADNAEFDLGIFSVAGETEKKTVRNRTDPRIDVAPGRTRMAGAGFAVRF
ncbi:MAG TPA: hypothetical protein VHM92_07020 [Allosphingosinicella sp.]|nr:hypothetical protein [Allosphingosinicella sp.]